MQISADILDDLLRKVFEAILEFGTPEAGGRGRHIEVVGGLLELTNPRARLSRSETKGRPFSALGELLWYLAGSDRLEFIERYIPAYAKDAEADGRLHGAYGPRLLNLRGLNQIANVTTLLTERPWTKRAVIQIYEAEDIARSHKEIPCTTNLQFLIRDDKLICCATMRSNDAFKGLPHDVFCFTMLQEIIAREIGIEVGCYKHFATSLHLYEDSINGAQTYLTEGFQSSIAMAPMPDGSQWPHLSKVLMAEELVRNGRASEALDQELPAYWQDIVRLLIAFDARGDDQRLDDIMRSMSAEYRTYLQRWKAIGPRKRKEG